ncbi:MAG: DUF4258 domain-containing protein [Candidatus Gracilibacteria bacterium]
MGIYYTKHILERLLQRGIDKKSIEYVLSNGINYLNDDGFSIHEGSINGKKLRIITQIKSKHVILITSYYI